MALPQLNTPSYEMTVPSTGEAVKFRPFLVKEQKLLMIAQETGTDKDMARAMTDIIKSCTDGAVKDVEKLPTFDIEYMFIQIRGKSVGDNVDITVTCPDDGETNVPVTVNLSEIKVQGLENHKKEIMVTDTIGLRMKYPTMDSVVKYSAKDTKAVDLTFGVIKDCLECIFDENEVYEDMSKKELDEFIESMNTEQFAKVQEFFDTMPKVRHVVKVTNPNTGNDNEIVLEGMQSFLD